jgi:hypothetical protein
VVDSSGVAVGDLALASGSELACSEVGTNPKNDPCQPLQQRGADIVLDLQVLTLVARDEPARRHNQTDPEDNRYPEEPGGHHDPSRLKVSQAPPPRLRHHKSLAAFDS